MTVKNESMTDGKTANYALERDKGACPERLGRAVNVRPHTRLSKGTMPSKRTWHGGTNRPHELPTVYGGSTLSAASMAPGTR